MLREAGDLLLRRVFCQEKSRSGFFALAGAAGSEAGVEIQTEIESYMILGADHEVQSPSAESSLGNVHHQVECLSFNFSMQRDGAISSLSIFHKDNSEETAGGQNELIWQLHSSQVAGDGWQEGMVPVRAHMVEDVIQNYTVRSGS